MEHSIKMNNPEEARKYFERKLAFSLGPVELDDYRRRGKEDLNIIDVRASEDYEEGHVPGAQSLPQDEWTSLKGLGKDKPNVIYCYSQTCHLAAMASVLFAAKGFSVLELDGGFEDYKQHELEIEKGAPQEKKTEKKTA